MYAKRSLIALLSIVIMSALLAASLPLVTAQDDEPEDVVEAFYTWYLDYIGTGEDFRNPMVDRAYRESDLLAAEFVAEIDALLESWETRDTPGGYDPFLCAQDVPTEFAVEEARYADDEHADVVVRTSFANHALTVELEMIDDTWLITDIICGETRTPRGVVESFYRWYIGALQWDGQGERPNVLAERGYRDNPLLTADFIARIDEALDTPQLGGGDPFLCAQDIPYYVRIDAVDEPGDDTALVEVSTSFDDHEFALELVQQDEQWLIDEVVCR